MPTCHMQFNISATDGEARVGSMQFPRGSVATPAFMPVGTYGSVKGLNPQQIVETGAEIILEILAHLAYIDRKLEDSEQKMIQSFADTWHLKIDWSNYKELADQEQPVSFVTTRDTVSRYLKTSPPEKQVAQLIDVLRALVMADESVSTQENLILEEIHGLLLNYISGSDMEAKFTVVIAPQNRDQDTASRTILPNVEKTEVAGGAGYLVRSFFTEDYANVICEQYRALGFFTIDMVGDDPVVV